MKTLALLPIAGALAIYGCAFMGIWTAPGLENFPTYSDFSQEESTSVTAAKATSVNGVFAVSSDQNYQPEGVSFASGEAPITLPAPSAEMLALSAQAASRKVPVQKRMQLPTPPPAPDPFAKHRIEPYRASTVGWRRRN